MIKVGIVEDSRTIREGLETIINLSAEYRCVCSCETAEEALEVMAGHAPEIVLMDIQLPGMSGIDCVERMKSQLPGVQVIMVTVYEDPDRIFSALRAGASGYLLKRTALDQVISAMEELRHGGAPMSGEIARKVISHFRGEPSGDPDVEKLTPREREVLEWVSQGFVNKEIADRMSVSVEAVRWHLKNIYAKLHVRSRTEAALKFRGPN